MTGATVRVTADEVWQDDGGPGFTAAELERVQVSFAAEEGGDTLCRHCGEWLKEELDEAGAWIWLHGESELCACDPDDEDSEEAAPEDGPGSWCNSASIVVDDDENSVTCSISVGDPRGGFTFQVRKVPTFYNGDGTVANPEYAGKLLLHVPYPGEGLPHMALTFDHDGTYVIGGVS